MSEDPNYSLEYVFELKKIRDIALKKTKEILEELEITSLNDEYYAIKKYEMQFAIYHQIKKLLKLRQHKMKKLIARIKNSWTKSSIMLNLFFKNIFKDENEIRVKYFFRQYLEDHDLHEGIWQLHHIGVKTKNDIVVTIILGRPGLLIGKGGRTIEEITNRLSDWLEKPVKIKIFEHSVF